MFQKIQCFKMSNRAVQTAVSRFKLTEGTNMKINQLKCILGSGAASGAFAIMLGFMLANAAWADDGKEYPGSMCKEGVDGYHQKRASGDVVFDLTGNALNISTTSSRYVTCPLVRDAENPQQGGIVYAAVNYYNASTTPIACTIVSTPYYGGTGWQGPLTNGSGSGGTNMKLLELPVQPDTFIFGSYNLWCLLPKPVIKSDGTVLKTGIAHYGIVEAE